MGLICHSIKARQWGEIS